MSKGAKITGYVACILVAGLAIAAYLLFHGYLDPGRFEIKQAQWSSTNQVAVVAERSDHYALGRLDYFVLVGNHLFTPTELRYAYHSDAVVFSALTGNDLTLRWDGPNRLIIRCNGPTVGISDINTQKRRVGNIAISYENIALK